MKKKCFTVMYNCKKVGNVNVKIIYPSGKISLVYRCPLHKEESVAAHKSCGNKIISVKKVVCCSLILCSECIKNARECISF